MFNKLKFVYLIVLLFLVTNITFSQEDKDALALWKNGNYESAVNVCLAELEDPETTIAQKRESYTVLCWALLDSKRYAEVIKYGSKAFEMSPRDWRIVASLGEAHYNLGNNTEALYLLEKYIELKSSGDKVDYVYYLMGHLFLRLEQYNRADVALSMAVFLRPLDARWWARLGYAREQAKDFIRAKEAYDKALSINPSLVDAERGKKRVHQSLGM